jgi:hypothetical protein
MRKQLCEPFEAHVVSFKPQSVKNGSALCIAYISAREVQDRLDDVFGASGWHCKYREFRSGVMCTLRVRFPDRWVTREDIGSESDQPDEGDRTKAAVSDSLKRAAVQLGIGRYLYNLDLGWLPWDQSKRQFASLPPLPEWALPTPITETQYREIVALALEVGVSLPTIANHYQVPDLKKLATRRFTEVMNRLRLKKAAKI